jgi:hypothetical protein
MFVIVPNCAGIFPLETEDPMAIMIVNKCTVTIYYDSAVFPPPYPSGAVAPNSSEAIFPPSSDPVPINIYGYNMSDNPPAALKTLLVTDNSIVTVDVTQGPAA